MKDQYPIFLTDTNIHSDTQAEPRKLSSLTLYIDLGQGGKPAPGQNPPVIFPPVAIFRRIGVRTEIRTQNPVLSNTRLAKMGWEGDGLAVNMSRQHVCVLRVRVPPLPPWVFWRLIWRTESLDRGFDWSWFAGFPGSVHQLRLRLALVYKVQGWMHVRNPVLLPNG
jgi:hypothetical protein